MLNFSVIRYPSVNPATIPISQRAATVYPIIGRDFAFIILRTIQMITPTVGTPKLNIIDAHKRLCSNPLFINNDSRGINCVPVKMSANNVIIKLAATIPAIVKNTIFNNTINAFKHPDLSDCSDDEVL